MVSEQIVVEKVISLLESNLTDPATDRASKGKKWIYDDSPREDISSYPRISVIPAVSNYESAGVGYTSQIEDVTINISVYTKKTDKFGGKRAEQLVDDLANQIRSIIKSNHDYFITNNIEYLVPETKNRSELNGLVIETMTFKCGYIN